MNPKIAVLIPCHNEEAEIAAVVRDFAAALPQAKIYVYDNDSGDRTAQVARRAGAIVRFEPARGKGNVVRRMFADVEADIYVLADGDGTYDAASAPALINKLLSEPADMVISARTPASQGVYRPGHKSGNKLLTGFVGFIFGGKIKDMLSGYRVMTRRFVKTFPALSKGFEIETELTVHALELRVPMVEVPTPYRERSEGSASKLRTYRDGARIFSLIFHLIKEEKPLEFFTGAFIGLAAIAAILIVPIMLTYSETGLVPRFPTAVLSASIVILAFLSLVCGLVLDTVTRGRREAKRLAYLVYSAACPAPNLTAERERSPMLSE